MSATPEEIREYVLRAQKRDDDAFDQLVKHHASLVAALFYARLPGMRDQHEDLIQEVFVRAFELLPRLRDPSAFASWICGIGRNIANEHVKSLKRETSIDSVPEPAAEVKTEEPTISSESFKVCLEKLPSGLQEAFLLRHVQDYSYRAIAEITSKTISNVSEKISRARKLLRNCLEAEGAWS